MNYCDEKANYDSERTPSLEANRYDLERSPHFYAVAIVMHADTKNVEHLHLQRVLIILWRSKSCRIVFVTYEKNNENTM